MPGITEALGSEEKPIIENIISLFQQLLTVQGDAAQPAVDEIVEMAEEEEEEESERDPAQAVDVKKTSEGETGDSKAEERLGEVTETTDESLNDLKKTLASLQNIVGNKTKVNKSTSNNNAVLNEIRKMNNTLHTVLKGHKNQEKLNEQLFDALGFSEELVKENLPVQKSDNKPIQNTDTTAVVKDILTEVFKNIPALNQNQETRHPFNDKRYARKNLRDIASFIHNKKR